MLTDNQISMIIEAALGTKADFAEVFIEDRSSSSVGLLNNKVTSAFSGVDTGIGIRVMSGTNSVYVYSNDFDFDSLIKMAKEASSVVNSGEGAAMELMSKLKRYTPDYIISNALLKQKKDYIDFLKKAGDFASNFDPMITQTAASLSAGKRIIRVVNSRGVNIEEEQNRIRFSVQAVATKDGEKQTGRIAPGTMRGYEFVDEFPIIEETQKCCESAIRMASCGYAPSGKMPVVIGNGFGGVIFHEACGHALEATSVGIKASCFTDKIGKQIASPIVSARDNARIEGEWGSYHYDDEGNESSDLQLIKNGICTNYLVDELGSRRMGMKPTGCSRRQDYSYAPTSRMSNTYIENGDEDPKDIIANTEYGLYAANMGGGSVDTATGEFNFAVNEGYMIRNGKVCEPVRGATLIGKGSEVLMNIDHVGNDLKHAAGVCGSQSGSVPTNVGQPTIRVSSILVGGRDS
ncbi:MAG: TldD/PmbA family protein [Clostridia bacterium]|nr:TldD/PmbA family protein [Clostridia bacterium]